MLALIVGIIFILFSVYAVLPESVCGFEWWKEVLFVLKGIIPVLAFFIGFIAVFIGIADIKDKILTKKEEAKESGDKQP